MKRGILLAAALCLTLTGCDVDFLPYARDIETIELIRTLGLDMGESEGETLVTVSGGVQRTGENGQGEKPIVLSQGGGTIYEACNVIQTFSDDYIFYGHVTEWVLGEEAAREGLTNLMDFMERDVEMRLNTQVFLVKGGQAKELLTRSATENTAATDRLSAILVDYRLKSIAYPYTMKEVLSQMEENGCGLMPAVVMEEKEEADRGGGQSQPSGGGQEGQGGEQPPGMEQGQPSGQKEKEKGGAKTEEISLRSVGYGYFKENRLIGFLDEAQSRGANLLLNQVKSGTVEVDMPDGGVAALRIARTHCKWEAQMENGRLTGMTARLEVETDIAEIRGECSPEDPEVLAEMRRELADILREETEGVLKLSQQEEADFLHLNHTAAIARPRYSSVIDKHWDEWFPELTLTVEVEGIIRRSYDISDPMKRAEAGETA